MLDTRQTNRFQMMLAVKNFMDSHQTTWSTIPIIGTFKTTLDAVIQEVKEHLQATGTDTSGMTSDKNQLKAQIAEKTAVLSGALAAYAAVNGQDDLRTNGYLTKSQIMMMRDVNMPEAISNFVALVTNQLTNLADYGITEDKVTDLESSLDDFRELVGQPRLKQSAANAAKREASSLIGDGVSMLTDQLDKVMLQFKFTNPTFHEEYERARVIVD